MKFCLNYNQEPTYLYKADEIKIPWEYKDKIQHYYETYDATIIVQHLYGSKNIDFAEYETFFEACDGELILALGNVSDCLTAVEKELPFYYGYPIHTYEEFNSLTSLQPEYIIPGAPIFFNLPKLKESNIPLRIFPNICTYSLFPKENNSTGIWVRPEDLSYYDRYVDVCEFYCRDREQERAFYRIYAEQKQFIGPIGLLIPDLREYGAENDLINPEYIPVRTYCQQKCESGERKCDICRNLLYLANPDHLKYLIKNEDILR